MILAVKAEIVAHPLITKLFGELAAWPGTVLNSHKSAGQLYHRMAFLAEIGLTAKDGPLGEVVGKILKDLTPEGIPCLVSSVSAAHGGNGQVTKAWALCDAPLQLWTLLKMESPRQDELAAGARHLAGLVRDNGWPCVVSPELAPFRGPGRVSDPCPYATLLMLKLLLLPASGMADSPAARIGTESLLSLWQNSQTQHPYIFYMGNDFRKLKAPFVWYDILHVADVLSQAYWVLQDPRFIEMLALINSKVGQDGRFTPESVWKAWDGWEFGQKKSPSDWLTFVVRRINRRVMQARSIAPVL